MTSRTHEWLTANNTQPNATVIWWPKVHFRWLHGQGHALAMTAGSTASLHWNQACVSPVLKSLLSPTSHFPSTTTGVSHATSLQQEAFQSSAFVYTWSAQAPRIYLLGALYRRQLWVKYRHEVFNYLWVNTRERLLALTAKRSHNSHPHQVWAVLIAARALRRWVFLGSWILVILINT